MAMEEKKKESNYIHGGNLNIKIGNTRYDVRVFFNGDKQVTVQDKIKRMIRNDVKEGKF